MTNSKIRIEENGRFQFDFSALEYVWEFHDVVAINNVPGTRTILN